MIHEGLILTLDGAVLRGQVQKPTIADLTAIRELMRLQVPIIIVSGRTRFAAQDTIKRLGIKEPAILNFGGLTWSPLAERVDETVPLLPQALQVLEKWAAELNVSPYFTITEGTFAQNSGGELAGFEPYLPVPEGTSIIGRTDVIQAVLPVSDLEQQQALLNRTAEELPDCRAYLRDGMVIFISSATNKGLAVRRLAARRGWNLRKFVAVGGDLTDLPLFAEVGLGVAIGTNPEIVRKSGYAYPSNRPDILARCISECFAVGDFKRWGW